MGGATCELSEGEWLMPPHAVGRHVYCLEARATVLAVALRAVERGN